MKCFKCNWHGSEDDALIYWKPSLAGFALLGGRFYVAIWVCDDLNKCKERQEINLRRRDPPDEYATGVDGYATAPQ